LKWFFGKDVGTVLSYLISFDTLQGFALAVYAVLLVELGRWFAAREGA
jgi:hypothetical protein